MLIVLAFAWAYVNFGTTPQAQCPVVRGQPVIIAVVVQAIYGLSGGRQAPAPGPGGGSTLRCFLRARSMVPLFGLSMVVVVIENAHRLFASAPERTPRADRPGPVVLTAAGVTFCRGPLALVPFAYLRPLSRRQTTAWPRCFSRS